LATGMVQSSQVVSAMWTIRGIYDGKTIRPLPGEPLPEVEGEVVVEITFQGVKQPASHCSVSNRLERLRRARSPLPFPVKELVEYGRAR